MISYFEIRSGKLRYFSCIKCFKTISKFRSAMECYFQLLPEVFCLVIAPCKHTLYKLSSSKTEQTPCFYDKNHLRVYLGKLKLSDHCAVEGDSTWSYKNFARSSGKMTINKTFVFISRQVFSHDEFPYKNSCLCSQNRLKRLFRFFLDHKLLSFSRAT